MLEIGIDLGTSNSLIGFFETENNEVKLIPNRFGKLLTPSVVSLDDDGTILVGEIAKGRQITHPDVTVSAFKRFMGMEKSYRLNRQEFTPVELSSFVLKSLKEDAEKFLEQPVEAAVISVPAYFNAFQREATISAAKLAGLTVRQLISEPTCAAIAYGLENSEDDQSFLVVDLGGGTYDVSLISLFEKVIQVEAIAGDTQLGGEDFTRALVGAALEKAGLIREKNLDLASELYGKAEAMKRKFADPLTLSADFKFEHNGQEIFFGLTQVEFRELVMPLLARLQRPTKRVMNDSHIQFEELDKVILVGGATRLQVVKQAFEKITGIRPSSEVNPDEVVAIGATIRSHMLNDTVRNELIMTDVIGFSLGTNVHNKYDPQRALFEPIIERNTTIPCSITKQFVKISEKQRSIGFMVYQGERPHADENLFLGEIEYPVSGLTMKDRVSVRYSYDESGILEVEIWNDKNDVKRSLVIQNRNSKLSEADIEKIRNKLTKLKVNPLEKDENRLIVQRFETVAIELLGYYREIAVDEEEKFKLEIQTGNPRRIYEATKRANDVLENLESLI